MHHFAAIIVNRVKANRKLANRMKVDRPWTPATIIAIAMISSLVPQLAAAQSTDAPAVVRQRSAKDKLAGDKPAGDNEQNDKRDVIDSLFEQLSNDRYSSRQRATLKMWGDRKELRDQVQSAARHPDPEVSARATWILNQWRRGTSPDMSPSIMRLLQKGDDPEAIVELIELGRMADAVVAVEESQQSIESDQIKQRITAALSARFPYYIQHAIENDSLHDMLRLVDLSATNKEMAVCRIRLMQRLGIKIDDDSLLPTSSVTWAPLLKDQSRVAVLMVLGRHDEAIKVAKESSNDNLLRVTWMLADRWQALADHAATKIDDFSVVKNSQEPDDEFSIPETVYWVHLLVAADRCGDRKAAARAITALASVRPSDDAFALAWKALAMHGQIDRVFEMLDADSPSVLVDVAVAASRVDVVFEKLNFPADQIDSELDTWIDEAIELQLAQIALIKQPKQDENGFRRQPILPRQPHVAIDRLLALMKCLIAVGRDADARRIVNRLSSEPIRYGSSRSSLSMNDIVMQHLVTSPRKEWIFDLAVPAGDDKLSLMAQWCSAKLMDDAQTDTFNRVFDALKRMFALVPIEQRYQMTCELLQGDVPDRFDQAVDFERLYEILKNGSASGLFGRRESVAMGMGLNHDIVGLFAGLEQMSLAKKCLGELAREGDMDAMYELAVQAANEGNGDVANLYFDVIWDRAKSDADTIPGMRFDGENSIVAMKAIIDQWLCTRRRGDAEKAKQLKDQIQWTLCSPSTEFCDAIAEHLTQFKSTENDAQAIAIDTFKVLLPLTAMGSHEATEFYDVARKYSTLVREQDPNSAIRWFDLAVGGTLESTYFRSSAYVTLPLYIRRWAVEAAVADKDRSAVQTHLQRLMQLDPMEISFAEVVLPEMRKAGMVDLADEVFDRIFDFGQARFKRFPFDITTGNNIAWIAAMNHRRLDEAVSMSEQTVYIEPESVIYRDTLAELLFLLGRKKEALQVEEACLLDDPTQWHLHKQVDKYRVELKNDSP